MCLALLGLATTGHVVSAAFGPLPGPDKQQRQLRFLENSIATGADQEMQAYFPEGDWFMHQLTGVSAARLGEAGLPDARQHLAELDSPETLSVFGDGMVPEHGIFAAGWALSLSVEIAAQSSDPADLADVARRAEVVRGALAKPGSPFPESYPGQYWPCDAVVAASALARAGDLTGQPAWRTDALTWRDRAAAFVDPATGLLPHKVDADGRVLDGPRGSSQSIIQYYWPDLDRDPAVWQSFSRTFVTRQAGLIGVREYPRGDDSTGDVDSGPLLLGVSASASAVTLGAARRWGDRPLAEMLARQAELLGTPVDLGRGRCYLAGTVPVGDAFVLWSQTAPEAPGLQVDGTNLKAAWPGWAMLGSMLPLAAAVGWAYALRRR